MRESLTLDDSYSYEVVVSHKETTALTVFWAGFVLYVFAFVLGALEIVFHKKTNLIQMAGLAVFLPASLFLIRFRIVNSYLRVVFFAFMLWQLGVVARGFELNGTFIKTTLVDAWHGALIYLTPMVLLFPVNIYYLKKVINVIIILGLGFLFVCAMRYGMLLSGDGSDPKVRDSIEYAAKGLSLPCGFIILTYLYHARTKVFFAFVITGITLLFATIRARRGLMMITLLPVLLSYFTFYFANRRRVIFLIIPLIIAAGLVAYGVKVFNENKRGAFALITERTDEDTRSNIEVDFFKDMNEKEWWIGKGMNGEYFSPGVEDDALTNYRSVIETDYLNIILKGGIIRLILLLLILIPAIGKGLFYSRNVLSKGAALWILYWLFTLYPATGFTFSMTHVLVWLSVGICFSRDIRRLEDSDIKEVFAAR